MLYSISGNVIDLSVNKIRPAKLAPVHVCAGWLSSLLPGSGDYDGYDKKAGIISPRLRLQSVLNRMIKETGAIVVSMVFMFLAGPAASDDAEAPLGAAVVIIETTDNDIELQVFVDGTPVWDRLEIFDPRERRIFNLRTQRRLGRQGLSELTFASSPDPFPVDNTGEIDPVGTIAVVEAFLRRFPAGNYEMEARLPGGGELEGEGMLTHVLPALPAIVSPILDNGEPPVVDPKDFVIEWDPVTTRFIGDGPVEIIEYQVIINQEEPAREMPWIDGGTRRGLINVPASVTSFKVPPELLEPNAEYELELLAIESSGNSTISVVPFVTGPSH